MRDYYFKIGEFAQVCGVKKATLVHYAKIGLFMPDHIGENGYYYYSPTQIYDFEAISLMRGMSVPLEEIAQYMKSMNLDTCRAMLEKQLAHLRERQAYLRQIEEIVEVTLRDMEAVKQEKLDVIEEITLTEPVHYYVYKMPYRTESAAYALKDSRSLIQHCHDSFINKSLNVSEVVLHEDVMNGSFAKTYGGFRAAPDAEGDNIFIRPAGTYLTLASRSGGDGIVKLYRELKRYADSLGYTICGNAYEEDLLCHIAERDRKHYLVRCFIHVEPRAEHTK